MEEEKRRQGGATKRRKQNEHDEEDNDDTGRSMRQQNARTHRSGAVMRSISGIDMRILELLARFRFAPIEVIRREALVNQSAETARAYSIRRLKSLRECGLIDRETVLGRTAVHYLTESGAAFMGVEGGSGVGVKLAEYRHDLACVNTYFALRDRGDRGALITEREARARTIDYEDNPYAIPITRPSGKKGIAWPDMISGDEGALIGYEVEWTPKSRKRLIHLMCGYGYSPHYRIGAYLTTSDSHSVVSAAAQDANTILQGRGLGRPILVRPLADITGQQCQGAAS